MQGGCDLWQTFSAEQRPLYLGAGLRGEFKAAEVLRIVTGYFGSEDFLNEHHSFYEIEAVHRFGNHGNILAPAR